MGELAETLQKYGGWGLSAILMVALVKLYADNRELSTTYIERVIGGLEAAKDAAEGMRQALAELRALLAENRGVVGDLTHQIGILVEKVQHGFGNTSAALNAFTRLAETERQRQDTRDALQAERERREDRDRGRS